MKTIRLDAAQHSALTVMLNIELRNRNLRKGYADTLNGIFKQLAGRDHDVWSRCSYYPDCDHLELGGAK